jgi:hypothetical protein
MIYCATADWFLVLAVRQETGVWGRFDHQRPGVGTSELVVIAFVVVLLAGSLVWQILKRRYQREFLYDSAPRLFGELCHAHHLDRGARRLLKRLASARGLKNMTELFLEPHHFDTATLPSALKSSAGALRQLRHKLFD